MTIFLGLAEALVGSHLLLKAKGLLLVEVQLGVELVALAEESANSMSAVPRSNQCMPP